MEYTTITFPGLGLTMNPSPDIDLGFMTIRWYGLIIAVGLLLAVIYGLRRAKRFGLKEDDILDGVLWIVPVAILCARLYYVAFSWDSYKDNLLSVLYIWEGGLAIYGGVIGAALCVLLHCKIKKVPVGAVLDVVALGFLIGQSIGRWGNFMNRKAFGAPVSQDFFLAMGLENSYGTVGYYHPTFLYESLWNAIGFVLLHFLSNRRRFDGQIALGYVAWYGFGRTFTEALRANKTEIDSLKIGQVPVSLLLAAVSCAVAVAVLLIQWIRQPDPARLFVNRASQEEAAPEAEEDPAPETEAADAEDTEADS